MVEKMWNSSQEQSVTDGGIGAQAGRDNHIHVGLSYGDVRQLVLDLVSQNFLRLAGDAADIAEKRITKITDNFLGQLQSQHPEGFKQAKDPDFQHALFTVQKEYARCGDNHLGDLLVDLLVDRTKHDSRTILQIVLNESLLVAPKLTRDQLATLSILFFLNYTVTDGLDGPESFYENLDKFLLPFLDDAKTTETSFRHLEYAGCGSFHPVSVFTGSVTPLENYFRRGYPGLFSKGLEAADVLAAGLAVPLDHQIFRKCMNDVDKIQVDAWTLRDLRRKAKDLGISNEDLAKLEKLQTKNLLANSEIKETLIKNRTYMEKFFRESNKNFPRFELTSVGIAIGHANVKKSVGEFTDLSIWIN